MTENRSGGIENRESTRVPLRTQIRISSANRQGDGLPFDLDQTS